MLIYVKPNSNCDGLMLTTLNEILGGQWEEESCWRAANVEVRTGNELAPRVVVGWSSLFGGSAAAVSVYRRIDRPAMAFVGADWGLRILANDNEDVELKAGTEHLPPGWGLAVMAVYDRDDVVTEELAQRWQG